MALQLADRVQQLGSANTTVSFNLMSTPAGFQAFSPAITTGNTLYYTAYDGTNWEVGVGTLTSSSLLTRTTILSSSNAGAAVSTFGATVTVWLDYPSEKSVVVNDLGDVLVNQSYDQGTGVLQVTGASSFNGAVVDKSLNLQGGNNLLKYSQGAFTTSAYWVQSGSPTIVDNNATAPNGTLTASQFTSTSSNSQISANTTVIGTNATYTQTWYVKQANTGTVFRMDLRDSVNNYAYNFNLSTLAVTSLSVVATSASMTSVGNGWYRLQITAPNATSGTIMYSYIYASTPTDSFYIWGAQLELGSVASAYTPTTTVAVTTTNNINVPSGSVTVSNGQVLVNSTSASVPNIANFNSTSSGFFISNNSVGFTSGGNCTVFSEATTNGFKLSGNYPLGFTPAAANANASDLTLYRDAANTLAQRNSTNAQTFRLYNTYTSSTSYENLQFDWTTTANTATISTQKGSGGGTARTLAIGQPLVISPGYTVATLPSGVVGMRAYVTNALAPSYGVAVAGGGATTIPVFYNGTAWICA